MFVRSHVHQELELVRWFALVILATALALLIASQASGGNHLLRDAGAPGLLPPRIDQWARPMTQPEESGISNHFTTVERVWRALEAHRAGDPVAALKAWETVHLPRGSQVWQQVAMSMAYLQCHLPDEAARSLAIARSIDPENPLVMYMLGILRLDQAEEAMEWYDSIYPAYIRLAAQYPPEAPYPREAQYPNPQEIAPNTRSMYELAAIQAFERSIEWAHHLHRDFPLVPVDWTIPDDVDSVMPLAAPCVGDLLQVIGADPFLGKSHWVLGEMYVERGALEHAEDHLDAARVEQIPTGVAFRKLARAYEDAGRHSDAARAYLKAMSPDAGVVGPAERALENFRKALWGNR